MSFNATSVPKWLLQHFGIALRNESLVGDLIEEYNSGKSALWLWRETVWAIAKTVATDVRTHPVLALRAVLVGWLVEYSLWWPLSWLQQHHETYAVVKLTLLCFVIVIPAIAGRIAALTKRRFATAMACAFVATGLLQNAWFFSVNYAAIWNSPNPHQMHDEIVLNLGVIVSTLIGGFTVGPRRPSKRLVTDLNE